jgi:ATP-binding cassette subfamily F protein 3
MEDFIRRFRYKESKARQAQSRIKALERLTRVEAVHEASPFRFSIRQASKQSDPLLQLRNADLGYTDPILSNITLSFSPGDRFGLLGVNGAGKSTLVKSLEGTLPLIDGERLEGLHLKTGYFSQHQVDDLDLKRCPLEHLQQLEPKANELKLRTFLGGFNFQGEQVETKAANFSGGEKARLALAIVSFQQPNLLLLDEPTNHLDMQMRQALATAMNTFEGAILVISHDRYLLSSTVDSFLLIRDGAIQPFEGTLSDYRLGLETKPMTTTHPTAMTAKASLGSTVADRGSRVTDTPKVDHKRHRQIATRIKTIETRLARLTEKMTETEQALSDPQHYSDPDSPTLQGLLRDRASLQSQIDDFEEEWLRLESEREGLS